MTEIRRPEVVVLPEGALVPETNVISPAPNHFTHEVIQTQPFYFAYPLSEASAVSVFVPGTKVNLLFSDESEMCRVADARGLYVVTACAGLSPLK